MDEFEYTLTEDEMGLISETEKAHQLELEKEVKVILLSIQRYRGLPQGNWKFEGGKLRR